LKPGNVGHGRKTLWGVDNGVISFENVLLEAISQSLAAALTIERN